MTKALSKLEINLVKTAIRYQALFLELAQENHFHRIKPATLQQATQVLRERGILAEAPLFGRDLPYLFLKQNVPRLTPARTGPLPIESLIRAFGVASYCANPKRPRMRLGRAEVPQFLPAIKGRMLSTTQLCYVAERRKQHLPIVSVVRVDQVAKVSRWVRMLGQIRRDMQQLTAIPNYTNEIAPSLRYVVVTARREKAEQIVRELRQRGDELPMKLQFYIDGKLLDLVAPAPLQVPNLHFAESQASKSKGAR